MVPVTARPRGVVLKYVMPPVEKGEVETLPVHLDVGFKGPHYGIPERSTLAALELVARQEGVLLDPVYSGKGFAGLLAACAPGGALHAMRNVLFLHTGGTAAMSVYPEVGAVAHADGAV